MSFKSIRIALNLQQNDFYQCLGVTRRQFSWKLQLLNKGINRLSEEEFLKIKILMVEKLMKKYRELDVIKLEIERLDSEFSLTTKEK